MASVFAAVDSHTPRQLGENLHGEFGWSNDLTEGIVQLSFQLVRTMGDGVKRLATQFDTLITQAKSSSMRQSCLLTLRKLLLQTRDIEAGKGEWALGYQLVHTWWQHFPEDARHIITHFVKPLPESLHPYGSWKDLKYLWRVFGGTAADADFQAFIVKLYVEQIRADQTASHPSLCARHLPREKAGAKHAQPWGPLFKMVAEEYYSHFIQTATTPAAKLAAKKKTWTQFRKTLATINKRLDTPQIKQCAGEYAELDYSHITSVTMRKQTRAFQNKTKDGSERSTSDDRRTGAANFEAFVTKAKNGEVSAPKGKRVGINTMLMDALKINSMDQYFSTGSKTFTQTDVDVLNLQWADAGSRIGPLGNFAAMVDLSGSMAGNPMAAAIGLGLRVAEKSALGKRVMTFSAEPKWINLDGAETLTDQVGRLKTYTGSQHWDMNTNFYKALKLMLNACVEAKLRPAEVADMVLVIFSDMQIDCASALGSDDLTDTMWERINSLYASAGRRAVGVPYTPPHILFWNLRHTSGFPTLSTQKNTTMFAGYSDALLNSFAEKGLEALKDSTPWKMLQEQLNHPRYSFHTPTL